ncbi:8764_t:CDS:2 [Entrophospora sp. SA101]|nr:8764_t:CDS:2 [Entrophospora sp. SA101]
MNETELLNKLKLSIELIYPRYDNEYGIQIRINHFLNELYGTLKLIEDCTHHEDVTYLIPPLLKESVGALNQLSIQLKGF